MISLKMPLGQLAEAFGNQEQNCFQVDNDETNGVWWSVNWRVNSLQNEAASKTREFDKHLQ